MMRVGLRWIFSHDTMRFTGMSLWKLPTRRQHGHLVARDSPFPQPPLPIGDRFLASAGTVYAYDTVHRMVLPRIVLPAGETLAPGTVSHGRGRPGNERSRFVRL